MTTMMFPQAARTANNEAFRRAVPAASTWNGGVSQRRVSVSTFDAGTRVPVRRTRQARVNSSVDGRDRGKFSQALLGGLLGLAAVIAMIAAPVSEPDDVANQPVQISSMQVK